jgi:hypothetical protein
MNHHSLSAAIVNHAKAKREGRHTSMAGGHAMKEKNKAQMIADQNTPGEVRHVLMDYRNGNERLAVLVMDRKKAYGLNERLKGTGMAFAVLTGY